MKRATAILFVALAVAIAPLRLSGAGTGSTNATLVLQWSWILGDQGGLSTNDYLTNIAFRVYCAPNIASPNWALYTNFYSTNYTFTAPSNFTATVSVSNSLLFFTATTVTIGGESPFSNRLPILPAPSQGVLLGAHP